ncbi:DUF3892 domain-containing protein [Sorangium sp. KYC3313]|uniref:DUF3892 domain-containing protein n=1 Tax=Sorangium sp. KYC3313 TaxID=3449740 RepID=UPI003F8AE724
MKRVTCITRTNLQGAHERIQALGGVNADGTRWHRSQADVASDINSGRCDYYVEQPGGHRVTLVVVRSSTGYVYVKTQADGEQPNNLLSLPDCR